MRTILIGTMALVAAAAMPVPSHAQPGDYPFCYSKSFRDTYSNCTFRSFAQCELYRSGMGGWCSSNPSYAERVRTTTTKTKKKKPKS
jgi:hypothetical protein